MNKFSKFLGISGIALILIGMILLLTIFTTPRSGILRRVDLFILSLPARVFIPAHWADRTEMLVLINKERGKRGLMPLREVKELDASAKVKACDLRDNKYFEHASPRGKHVWNLATEAGYAQFLASNATGENLAHNFQNEASAAAAWMMSPTHKRLILKDVYTDMGFAQCGDYMVVHFGGRYFLRVNE